MTDILRLPIIVLLLTVSLAAYFLVIDALFASRLTRTQRIINQMPGRSFWVGLVNFLFFGVILVILLILTDGNRVPDVLRVILYFPTFLLSAILGVFLSLGLTAMVDILGERIFPGTNIIKRSVLGSVVLSFACALPFVGWFLLLPYVGLVGIGAMILGFFQREQ